MHVLFLADGLFPFVVGGMQKHSTMLIKHLSPLVDQITVCTCGEINAVPPSEEDILDELVTSKDNIQVLTCAFEDRGKFPGHYLRASRKLSRTFFNLAGDLSQYDCIYAQGLTGDAFLEKHPRVLVNLHGLNMFQPSFSWKEEIGKRMMRPLFAKQIREAWKTVALGGKLSDILVANGAKMESVVVLPNGVDDIWFDTPKARKKTQKARFLMVGRNDPAKGYRILKDALALIDNSVEIHFVGDWPELNSARHKLIYHGVIRDQNKMIDVVDSCDVILLPSLSEGMPTVVLEAKARGLQVLATDVGSMSDLEMELLPPGDVKEMALKMTEVKKLEPDSIHPVLSESYRWSALAQETIKFLSS